MLTGLEVVLGVTLWLARPKEPMGADAAPIPKVVAIDRDRRSIPPRSSGDPAVDEILVAWEKATIENPRTGCSFRRFRYDHKEGVEYRAEGEMNVYHHGSWDYRAEAANIQPIVLRRKPVPGKAAFEVREDFAERLLISREKVKICVTTEEGPEERTVPTFYDLFDWNLPDLLPLFSKEPAQPPRALSVDNRPIDISGLPFAHNGVTPSAAIVPMFLAGMRRDELLKHFEVRLVDSRRKDQVRMQLEPRLFMTAKLIGDVQIILNREGYVPDALLLTFYEENSEIVHVFQNWTFGKSTK